MWLQSNLLNLDWNLIGVGLKELNIILWKISMISQKKKKKNSVIKFQNHHSSIFMELIFQHGELYLHDEL